MDNRQLSIDERLAITSACGKWTQQDYAKKDAEPGAWVIRDFIDWKPPQKLTYPCEPLEKSALLAIKSAIKPFGIYGDIERQAIENQALVEMDLPIPDGQIAFLENTAEQCISPQTKHSQEGMQGARHWVQRVDTPDAMFQRLTDGYGISLMFGERCHQFIRNSHNWRGIYGVQLDLDVWYQDPDALTLKLESDGRDADFIKKRLAKNEKHPRPVYSQDALFERYPLIPRICAFVIPSASSLFEGRPFKARGVVLFPEPVTDMRVYRQFGDILCGELDCIPQHVTNNPVAVGFGNTHNAPQAYRNEQIDTAWISDRLQECAVNVITETRHRVREKQQRAKRKAHYASRSKNGTSNGENISAFIEQCDPVAEMLRDGLLTRGRGNEYQWHESEHARSCDIVDGSIHIFSHSMFDASPHQNVNEAVGAHRFFLYQLSGLDMTKEADKPDIRQFLFERGYGRDPKSHTQAKLQRDTDAEPNPTETLEANRENREQAADTFMEAETESLHILLVKDSTGTGKSHTIILKSKQHDKRTLAQLPHTDLASQAVSIAWEHGYTSPYHLLGRGHNWDDSGIAEIPIENRTADLFEKNNCIMCDCVEEYTEKRLAPRTYCEHKCGFRDDCLHLSQYEGLGDRDFVASCTPNLLFDLNMRGYLQSLVTATDEPSDEELAIDAILGTESEATENFDFAILDDYGINSLYTDITLRHSEFKALKKAWKDTPTADFATLVLKAFEKKKPHKIVKALRNAYESTADWHTDISDALTQHARIGIVEKAERPKGSKESKRLLAEKQIRFVDGGTQFIPVDWDAYKELTDKGIPSVNCNHLETEEIGEQVRIPHTPTHALIAGVSVQDLTPIWQKGATPIELLGIFLESIGNDKNAPISRTGESHLDVTLTFSIPPQAPIGVLPQIAMLSATTNPADTQRAFDGQDVTFSVHEGGNLEWADGVEVYQFQDARLTAASVFDYPLTADGKRKLQDAPLGLTATAEKRLAKLNDWAKTIDGVTAFISYKEFTEVKEEYYDPIKDSIEETDTPFADAVNGFDEVKHFHEIEGLNFDGLKFLVVFGYPKALHESITEQARKQYASDSEPLPKADPNLRDEKGNPISEYLQLTETAEYQEKGNLTITESRYTDARLEKIRKQWATEKLEQAIGRARLSRWTDTTTLIFTDTPIPHITDRSTLFSSYAFNLAESANGLSDAMNRIAQAETSGDVKAVMETKGVSKRTARRQTEDVREVKDAEIKARASQLYSNGADNDTIIETLKVAFGKKVTPRTLQRWRKDDKF